MSDRLAADKDFQQFAFLTYELIGKVQESKSEKLLQAVLENRNSEQEAQTLLANLGFSTIVEFKNYWQNVYQLRYNFRTKFSEDFNNVDVKATIEQAVKKISPNQLFLKAKKLPAYVCWGVFTATLAGCQIIWCNGSEDWYSCMSSCAALATSEMSLCYLFAD